MQWEADPAGRRRMEYRLQLLWSIRVRGLLSEQACASIVSSWRAASATVVRGMPLAVQIAVHGEL